MVRVHFILSSYKRATSTLKLVVYVLHIWCMCLYRMQTLVTDFQEEQQKFEREKQRVKDTAVPPWVGYNEEEKMKAQILDLSAVSPF